MASRAERASLLVHCSGLLPVSIEVGTHMATSNTVWSLLAVFAWLAAAGAGRGDDGRSPQVYVVYMGAVPPRTSPDLLLESHLRLVATVLKRSSSSQS